jgi:SAM-dependent methyltransferase
MSADEPISSWERLYNLLEPENLPWNAGRPDPELVGLVESGFLRPGRALDVGTGLGHDAVFLASKGFQVTAVDISPAAVKLAAERAQETGVADKVEFKTADVLNAAWEPGSFSFVNDRGLFHYLRGPDRQAYAALLARVLASRGVVLLAVVSDAEPPCLGPLRYSEAGLREVFETAFSFEGLKPGVLEGPGGMKALRAILRKRG